MSCIKTCPSNLRSSYISVITQYAKGTKTKGKLGVFLRKFLEVIDKTQRSDILQGVVNNKNFRDKYTDCTGNALNFKDGLGDIVSSNTLDSLMGDLEFTDENSEDRYNLFFFLFCFLIMVNVGTSFQVSNHSNPYNLTVRSRFLLDLKIQKFMMLYTVGVRTRM